MIVGSRSLAAYEMVGLWVLLSGAERGIRDRRNYSSYLEVCWSWAGDSSGVLELVDPVAEDCSED